MFGCCCCSKKPKRNIRSKLKFGNACYFCGLATEGLIQECKTIAYHQDCLDEKLEAKAVIELHCKKSKCPLYVEGVGHSVRFEASDVSVFKGRWRQITTNLLLFSLASCFLLLIIGGNRPNSESQYNWIPPAIIQVLFLGNLSHLIAVGWETFWVDALTVLSLGGAATVLFYDWVPHILEFLTGSILTSLFCVGFFIFWSIVNCCCQCSLNSCSRCKRALFRRSYTKYR